ncbi:MAG: hypothetical protein JW384_03050 [Nitrosomonadaceae bacterium]|nr:hypothetical protein [Nitrosomonadaceae bacterium]
MRKLLLQVFLIVTVGMGGISPVLAVPPSKTASPTEPKSTARELKNVLDEFNIWYTITSLPILSTGKSGIAEGKVADMLSLINVMETMSDSLLPVDFPKELVKENQSYINHLFEHFIGLNMVMPPERGGTKIQWTPLSLAKIDSGFALMVMGISSPKVFNTAQTTGKTRAGRIIEEIILPNVKGFDSEEIPKSISHVGMVVVYASQNFSESPPSFSQKPEVLAFITPKGACSRFVAGKLDQEAFLSQSIILLRDRYTSGQFKRITLQIE